MRRLGLYVDAGGSSTRMRVVGPSDTRTIKVEESLNPASGGESSSIVEALATAATSLASTNRFECVIASASTAPSTLVREVSRWSSLLEEAGAVADLLVTNDAIPLVSQKGPGAQLGMVLGTGSCVVAQKQGEFFRFGGREWLASDEGGATHLGWVALRSLAMALDGRRKWSGLYDKMAREQGAEDLLRAAAEHPHPKRLLADIAPHVLSSAFVDADDNALAVVATVLTQLDELMSHAVDRVGTPSVIRLTGGLLSQPGYRDRVLKMVSDMFPAAVVEVVADVTVLCESMDWSLTELAAGYSARLALNGGS